MRHASNTPTKILFICYSKKEKNSLVPRSADVRCVGFANHLNNYNREFDCDVVNFNRFDYFSDIGGILGNMLGKFSMLYGGFFYILSQDSDKIFYVQKNGWAGFVTYLASVFKKNVIVLDVDDFEYEKGFLRVIFDLLAKRSKYVVCANRFLSDMAKKEFIHLGIKRKTFIIPGGVETSQIRESKKNISKKYFVLLWAGNINAEASKNLEHVLDIFTQVYAKKKNIVLEIRGDGSHLSDVESYIKKNKISGVKIVGRQKDFTKYLEHIDVGINYLFDTPYDKGKNPGKLYTYLAAGLPIVGTDVSDNCETIIDGWNGYRSNSDVMIVKRILYLESHRELIYKFGRNSRVLARTIFDRKILARKLGDIIKKEI